MCRSVTRSVCTTQMGRERERENPKGKFLRGYFTFSLFAILLCRVNGKGWRYIGV